MRRILVLLLCLGFAGCASTAPQIVQDSLLHNLEDFALFESELATLIPADATVAFKTITGSTDIGNARQLYSERMRSLMFRGAGLLAWSRGEPYDEQAAFAKLFPDKALAPTDDDE